jgi:DNA polymerase III epsilon subunit-like protein
MTTIFFDTETTGLPGANLPKLPFGSYHAPTSLRAFDSARLVQIAWIVQDANGVELKREQHIIKPNGEYPIPSDVVKIHGITAEIAEAQGEERTKILGMLASDFADCSVFVCHNANFDSRIVASELIRAGLPNFLQGKTSKCTMEIGTNIAKIPKPGKYGGYKWPSLTELHKHVFGKAFGNAHSALADTEACMKCYNKIVENDVRA